MRKFIFKWLKRLWAFLAANLIIIALLLTVARIASTDVNTYKIKLIEWIAAEHDIHVSVEEMSAGVDFSGLVLTLKNVSFVDAPLLPFELKLDHLFLHLDFLNTIKQQTLVFNDISLKGADLILKSSYRLDRFENSSAEEDSTEVTLDSLKSIFLSRLTSFSIKDSQLSFTNNLSNQKTIYIQDLSWLNDGIHHQGVGKASLPDTLGENTLEFLIDITGDAYGTNDQLIANVYAYAENLNISDYLKPQINPLAELKTANISFKLWSEFDFNGPKNLLFEWGSSQITWSLLGQSHDWKVNDGLVQLSYKDRSWLYDTYDVNLEYNFVPKTDIKLSGSGINGESGEFDINGINLNTIVPFALLFSSASENTINTIKQLEVGGELKTVNVTIDNPGELTINANVDAFNNQAVGAIPGISDANIEITSNKKSGKAGITLSPQNILFDGQFNRSMPVQSAVLELSWLNNVEGLELKGEKVSLVTDELTSLSQFSLFIPHEKVAQSDPFLSLYSYVSLNDASKAQHYFPIVAMGEDVFEYLQPTLKKGSIEGAKVLWYGSLSDYPYQQKNGIFQAFVPIQNAQYDFYEDWQGLNSLDLDLLFENDTLSMTSQEAKLGDINLNSLVGEIDHLSIDGVITINAHVEEDAQKVSKYFIGSPLKDSVGEALKIVHIKDQLNGDIKLSIPLVREKGEPVVSGVIELLNNDVDIKLGEKLAIPLKKVKAILNFTDGKLIAKGISANLFQQPVDFSFSTNPLEDQFQVNMDFSGQWDAAALSLNRPELSLLQLSGTFDWLGNIAFSQFSEGGYRFDLNLFSPLQGMKIQLPIPYNKNALQTWSSTVNFSGNELSAKWYAEISNKVKLLGELDYQTENVHIPYAYIGLGNDQNLPIDYTKQVIRVNEDSASLTAWTPTLQELILGDPLAKNKRQEDSQALINIDEIYINIKQAELFEEPLLNFDSRITHIDNFWNINTKANDLVTNIEFRKGIPDRFDINIDEMNLQFFNVENAVNTLFIKEDSLFDDRSENLREDYPEVFLECKTCLYQKMDFSNLTAHVFPSQSRYTIDYIKLGGEEDQFTNISGVWDQRRTNIIVDSKVDSDTSLIHSLGYATPVIYQQAEVSGALNWIGAPWQFNLESLSGVMSADLEDGIITEVNDNGARLLSFFSLDAIRRSLNLEFGNVFSKGLGFDSLSISANFNNGIVKSDDFYLDGSAGKISGGGLIDLPNLNVNYRLSYSPAVTSSLPVLAAFAVNPLTGAAVLMLTKILEPVVDAIIRVDFSIKGSILDPVVKIESSEKGEIKLQNSAVLEEMGDRQVGEGGEGE